MGEDGDGDPEKLRTTDTDGSVTNSFLVARACCGGRQVEESPR